MLIADGWRRLPGKATSHEQYKHPTKPGKVTLCGKESTELPDGVEEFDVRQVGSNE